MLLKLHNNALNFNKDFKNIFQIFTFYKALLWYILFPECSFTVCRMFGFIVGKKETVFGKHS